MDWPDSLQTRLVGPEGYTILSAILAILFILLVGVLYFWREKVKLRRERFDCLVVRVLQDFGVPIEFSKLWDNVKERRGEAVSSNQVSRSVERLTKANKVYSCTRLGLYLIGLREWIDDPTPA